MLTISQVKSDSEIIAVGELIREFTAWAISLLEGSENAPEDFPEEIKPYVVFMELEQINKS